MYANPQRPCLRWTALALLVASTLLSGGCAKFFHDWHYNPITLSLHEHRLSYYHSPHTGRIIPREHHAKPMVEFPCFGYESTCWHRWPAECGPCPVQDADGIVLGGPYGSHVVEEMIGQPAAEGAPSQTPSTDAPSSDVPATEALPDDGLPSDAPAGPLPSDDESLLPSDAETPYNPAPLPGDSAQRRDEASVPSDDSGGTERSSDKPIREEAPEAIRVENSLVAEQPALPSEASLPTELPEHTANSSPDIEKDPLAELNEHVDAGDDPPSVPVGEVDERAVDAERFAAGKSSATEESPATVDHAEQVAQRSSRRAGTRQEAAQPAPPSAEPVQPSKPRDVSLPETHDSLIPQAPIGTTETPLALRPVSARTAVQSRSQVPTITAVHRTDASRHFESGGLQLPSFKIVPVLASSESATVTPMQVLTGPNSSIRFLSDDPPAEATRVADQTGVEATLRFR